MTKVAVVTAPTVEPVELEDAKAHLRLTHAGEDATVIALIQAARQSAEQFSGRSLIQQTRRLYLDAFPEFEIEVPFGPVSSVVSVTYVDPAGVTQTLAGANYVADLVADPAAIWPAYGKSWPGTRTVPNAVIVEYVAGYGASADAVPAPVRQWILLQVGAMFENREAVADRAPVALPFADGLIDPYRVPRL